MRRKTSTLIQCLLPFLVSVIFCGKIVIADSWNPRRPGNEEKFLQLNHHEQTLDEKSMNQKLEVIKARRKFNPWNFKHPVWKNHSEKYLHQLSKKPNILLILADDLGYGDLSVEPFVSEPDVNWPCAEGGILTPQLERMAAKGIKMTNFHSAAPVCSPSRVAIMTAMYPWRLNALNAFELGKDLSQRNGFLPQVVTGPEIFREMGYYTAHSGKWHLGGMREEMRIERAYHDKWAPGSPNQHGFEEYISELDGPESPRYTFLNGLGILHSKGHRHLLQDDVPMPKVEKANGEMTILSDREAEDAIRMMKQAEANYKGQPWYIQVWFNAPHGPWELLPSAESFYSQKHNQSLSYWKDYKCSNGEVLQNQKRWRYKTMVTAMDRSIGLLLDAVRDMGIESNTIIVFTSDNGFENEAGTAGPYKEMKRSLMEGGIRVPTIIQWAGHIPAGSSSSLWAAHTDLLPTFLEAAEIKQPANALFDGVSLLPALLAGYSRSHAKAKEDKHLSEPLQQTLQTLKNRVFLWHKSTDPFFVPRIQSAGYLDQVKVMFRDHVGYIDKIFDFKHDPFESVNLLDQSQGGLQLDRLSKEDIVKMIAKEPFKKHCETVGGSGVEECVRRNHERIVEKIEIIVPKLRAFVRHGSDMFQHYMAKYNPHATIQTPLASQLPSVASYFNRAACEASFTCSLPAN